MLLFFENITLYDWFRIFRNIFYTKPEKTSEKYIEEHYF